MDKDEYCQQMEKKLQEMSGRLQMRADPQPSTLEASLRQNELKRTVEDLKNRVAEALAKVSALRTSTDPSWETAKEELDRRWKEISELGSFLA